MPATIRATASTLLAAVIMLPTVALADALPAQVGTCSETTISFIGGRLQGDDNFETGTAVQFDNGGMQISYDREEGVVNSQIGDPVRVCLVSVPEGCPPGDDRGKVYATTNLRTGGSWEMPDSSHMCGGA